VRFHVRYGAHPIVVMACRDCNWLEMILRTGAYQGEAPMSRRSPWQPDRPSRAELLTAFFAKFGIVIGG